MGIDLEALANDLRAAGWETRVEYEAVAAVAHAEHVHQIQLMIDPWFGDGGSVFVESDGENAIPIQSLAIIARHLGAGQPVAADRAALVERMAKDIWDAADGYITRVPWPPNGLRKSKVLVQAEAALSAVEASGWGPRAEPVAPPEPLSAEERDRIAKAALDAAAYDSLDDPWCTDEDDCSGPVEWDNARELWRENGRRIASAVLAALPARFAAPVEGA